MLFKVHMKSWKVNFSKKTYASSLLKQVCIKFRIEIV